MMNIKVLMTLKNTTEYTSIKMQMNKNIPLFG